MYDKTGVRVVIMCPGITMTSLIANIPKNMNKSIEDIIDDIGAVMEEYPTQTIDNVASAMLDLIRKGKNGAVWVSEGGQPPYAVNFTHYSKRSLPV